MSSTETIETDVRRLRLEEGDILVFTLAKQHEFMSPEEFQEFAEHIKKVMAQKAPGHECLVLGPGIEITAVSQDDRP